MNTDKKEWVDPDVVTQSIDNTNSGYYNVGVEDGMFYSS
jgi:hypothetical protein